MPTLAVDPGDKVGVAVIGNSGELLKHWILPHEEFVEELAMTGTWFKSVDLVVVEDFKLLPHKGRAVASKHSRNVTAARGIGALQLWTAQRAIELIYRDPTHWRIGLQLAGIEPSQWPKNHDQGHHMCAYGAGFHALVELGLVQSRLGQLQ